MRVFIIGGGIAGFTVSLAARKVFPLAKIFLFEKEALPFSFASSRNAAIARSYEADPTLSLDVKKSIARMLNFNKNNFLLLNEIGLLLQPLEYDYYENDPQFANYDGLHSQSKNFTLFNGDTFQGSLLSSNGIIDIHLLQQYFLQQSKEHNIQLTLNSLVSIKKIEDNFIRQIQVNEETIDLEKDDLCIVAAGSWSHSLLASLFENVIPLVPHKRHIFFLNNKEKKDFHFPVLWNDAKEFYIRPETGGLLASHGDQTVTQQDDFEAMPQEVEHFERSALHIFPWLEKFHVANYWACLRTFALDGRPVIGFDASIKNLFWNAGLGGRGMSMSMVLEELCTQALSKGYQEQESELDNPYSAHRFF